MIHVFVNFVKMSCFYTLLDVFTLLKIIHVIFWPEAKSAVWKYQQQEWTLQSVFNQYCHVCDSELIIWENLCGHTQTHTYINNKYILNVLLFFCFVILLQLKLEQFLFKKSETCLLIQKWVFSFLFSVIRVINMFEDKVLRFRSRTLCSLNVEAHTYTNAISSSSYSSNLTHFGPGDVLKGTFHPEIWFSYLQCSPDASVRRGSRV